MRFLAKWTNTMSSSGKNAAQRERIKPPKYLLDNGEVHCTNNDRKPIVFMAFAGESQDTVEHWQAGSIIAWYRYPDGFTNLFIIWDRSSLHHKKTMEALYSCSIFVKNRQELTFAALHPKYGPEMKVWESKLVTIKLLGSFSMSCRTSAYDFVIIRHQIIRSCIAGA